MNAAVLFERRAKQAFFSSMPRTERSQKLRRLSAVIERFARRLSKAPDQDQSGPVRHWDAAARERAIRYMERLASDVRYLAYVCDRGG